LAQKKEKETKALLKRSEIEKSECKFKPKLTHSKKTSSVSPQKSRTNSSLISPVKKLDASAKKSIDF
jgi:hypothetical protein